MSREVASAEASAAMRILVVLLATAPLMAAGDPSAGQITPFDGCTPNLATLSHTAGTPEIGSDFTVTLDEPQTSTVLGLVYFASQPIATYPPCGIPLAGAGELLLDLAPPNPVASFVALFGGAPAEVVVAVPDNIQLVGLHLVGQGLFVASLFPPETYRLTNGIDVLIGDG